MPSSQEHTRWHKPKEGFGVVVKSFTFVTVKLGWATAEPRPPEVRPWLLVGQQRVDGSGARAEAGHSDLISG